MGNAQSITDSSEFSRINQVYGGAKGEEVHGEYESSYDYANEVGRMH